MRLLTTRFISGVRHPIRLSPKKRPNERQDIMADQIYRVLKRPVKVQITLIERNNLNEIHKRGIRNALIVFIRPLILGPR
jgi:hypothetical protein